MPKKKKGGSRGSSPEESGTASAEIAAKNEEMAAAAWDPQSAASAQQPHRPDSEQERVFLQVQEMFKNKVDGDVIFMVLSECDWKVEDALEKLFTLTSENEAQQQHQALSMTSVAQALGDITTDEEPPQQSENTAVTNASNPIPITANANPSGLRLDVHARLPDNAEQNPAPDFLTILSPKTPAGVSLDFPELFHGNHGCSAGRDSAMKSAMEALGAYANNPTIGILPRYDASKPGYPANNSFEQSLVTDQNYNANMSTMDASDYHQQPGMFGGGPFGQPPVVSTANFPPSSSASGQTMLFPSVELGKPNNTDFHSNYTFDAAAKDDADQPGNQQGPLPDLPHIVYNAQGMPVRKGHRKKTLSLDPAEREALENLIEDVIIVGMDEGVNDSASSSDSDSCDTIEKEASPKASDTLSPEDQRKFLAGDGGQHECKDGDANKRGKQEKGKDGGKVYPAQLKVAVKHMKSLPPRFLRRLQTAQKQLEANAKKTGSPESDLKVEPLGWNGRGQMMTSPMERERDMMRDKSRAKEEHLREKKKKIRNLLDDLDQYTDETTVIIEEKEKEEPRNPEIFMAGHGMTSPTSPPMGPNSNVMSCADLERELLHPLQQQLGYGLDVQLTPAELAELTHKMSPMAQRMASLAAASQPNIMSLAAMAEDSLDDYSMAHMMAGERSQFSVDAPEFVPKGFMPPVSFNQPPPPIISHSGQMGLQNNVSVMSMGQPLPSGVTPEQLQAFQQQVFLQKPSSPFQQTPLGRVSPHVSNTIGRLSPQIVTSQIPNMPPPQLSPEQRGCNSPLVMPPPPKGPPIPRSMTVPPPTGVVPYPSYSIPPPPSAFPPRLPAGFPQQQFPFRPPFMPHQQGYGPQGPWPNPDAESFMNQLRGHRPPTDNRHGSPRMAGPRGPRGMQGPRLQNSAPLDITGQSMTPEMAKFKVDALLKEGRRVMVILRGPPGSGKSTIAREIQFEGIVLNTDDFFLKPNGQYQYDYAKIGDAHQWNQQRAKEACDQGCNPIVIDNTNTQAWEMKYYVALADEHMYHVEIMEPNTHWKYKPKELAKRNGHGVPVETIVKMLDRYERNITPASILATLPKRKQQPQQAPVIKSIEDKADSTEATPTVKKTRKRKRKRKRDRKKGKEVNKESEDEEEEGKKGGSDSETEKDPSLPQLPEKKEETSVGKESLSPVSEGLNSPKKETSSPDKEQSSPDKEQSSPDKGQSSPDKEQSSPDKEQSSPDKEQSDKEFSLLEDSPVQVMKESSSTNEDSLEMDKNQFEKFEGDSEQFEMEDVQVEGLTLNSDETLLVGSAEWRKSQRGKDGPRKISVTLADLKEALLQELAECDSLVADDPSSSSEEEGKSEDPKLPSLASTPSKKEPPLACIPEVPLPLRTQRNVEEDLWFTGKSVPIEIKRSLKDDKWQLPNYVSNKEFFRPPPRTAKSSKHEGTFTTTADIVTMQKIERGERIYFPEGPTKMISCRARVISEGVAVCEERAIPTGVFMVDTSTMTDEPQQSSGIDFLQSCFSTVSAEDLGEILTQCQGNVEWAVNILLDSGYEYNDTQASEEMQEIEEPPSPMVEQAPSSPHSLFYICLSQRIDLESSAIMEEASRVSISRLKKIKDFQESRLSEKTPEMAPAKRQVPEMSEGLDFALPSVFATRLLEMLGPVGVHTTTDSMSASDRTVPLDATALQEIHRCWNQHLLKRLAKDEVDHEAMLSADEAYARRLQAEEDDACQSPRRGSSPAKSLRVIMQEEEEIEASKAQFIESQAKASGQHGALSTQLKFQQLTAMFPTLGRDLLEEVFKAHSYCLEDTVHGLQLVHGPSQPVNTHLPAEPRGDEPTSDFWLNPADEMSDDATYTEHRSEAFLHYQLRDECLRKAQEAFRGGMAPVAAFYSQQGHLHTEKLRLANRQAAATIFQRRNADLHQSHELDLHGLHVDEALEVLRTILAAKRKENLERPSRNQRPYLTVITGRGNHSRRGVARLRPSVMEYLRRKSFRFTETHPGILRVMLTRPS